MSRSIIKSHVLLTCKNFTKILFSDLTWKNFFFAPGNGGGGGGPPPAPSPPHFLYGPTYSRFAIAKFAKSNDLFC